MVYRSLASAPSNDVDYHAYDFKILTSVMEINENRVGGGKPKWIATLVKQWQLLPLG